MMSTITLKKDEQIGKTTFSSLYDLYMYIEENIIDKNLGKIMKGNQDNTFVEEKDIFDIINDKI